MALLQDPPSVFSSMDGKRRILIIGFLDCIQEKRMAMQVERRERQELEEEGFFAIDRRRERKSPLPQISPDTTIVVSTRIPLVPETVADFSRVQ